MVRKRHFLDTNFASLCRLIKLRCHLKKSKYPFCVSPAPPAALGPLMVVLLIACLLVSGCGRVGGVSVTATPVPATDTPQPTATATHTPEPTATATSTPTEKPSPTATLDRTATAEAKKSATAEAINALVAEDLEDYGVDPADGHVVWTQSKPVKMELTTYEETADQWLDEVGVLSDFVIQTRVKWTTSGALSLCGVTFRAEDDKAAGARDRFMMMRLQYAPGWTVWYWDEGRFQSHLTGGFISSRDIHDDNGSSNIVALLVQGKKIDIFLNGDKQRQVEDPRLTKGLLALSSFQESGRTECQFTDTWVWAFDQ